MPATKSAGLCGFSEENEKWIRGGWPKAANLLSTGGKRLTILSKRVPVEQGFSEATAVLTHGKMLPKAGAL